MSFSFENKQDNISKAISDCKMKNSNIVFVASAGDANTKKIMFPASLDNVISVVSTTYINDIVTNSNSSEEVNLIVNMNKGIICLRDQCEINNSPSLATVYASAKIINMQDESKKIDLLNKKRIYLDFNLSFNE